MLTWYEKAASEWIAAESGLAHAYWAMVHDSARRSLSARIGTRIDALVILASAIRRAIRANCALGFTTGRCADVSRQTRTDSLTVALSALTVWSAGRRLAGIGIRHNRCKEIGIRCDIVFKITMDGVF